jgi:hypothetical protein
MTDAAHKEESDLRNLESKTQNSFMIPEHKNGSKNMNLEI